MADDGCCKTRQVLICTPSSSSCVLDSWCFLVLPQCQSKKRRRRHFLPFFRLLLYSERDAIKKEVDKKRDDRKVVGDTYLHK